MIRSNQLYTLLKDKGVSHLHHANTMLTSLTFINNRALLSRKYVEENTLMQTPQGSDESDKKFDVWDDVFLDGLDLHNYYNWENTYGPVLFKIKLEILLSPQFQQVYVTTNNPQYWKAESIKYYDDIAHINRDYLTGNRKLNARIMFTFKSSGDLIRLNKFCESIIVDNPNILFSPTESIADRASRKILQALKENGLGHIPVSIRHSGSERVFCKCFPQYNYMFFRRNPEFKKRFATPGYELKPIVPNPQK